MKASHATCVYLGSELAAYGFGETHPFGPARHDIFRQAFYAKGLDREADILTPVRCAGDTVRLFHSDEYVGRVKRESRTGGGYLDLGDTPAFAGMYEAATTVAGSVCDAVDRVVAGQYRRAFIPIAGLHHARRDGAAGFCVFNDCGIAIEHLRHAHGIRRIAYVDIDAHHGDGVFYAFVDDPELIFIDLHEDGRYLYPGTGDVTETGEGAAAGTKLNIPMPPQSDDDGFLRVWPVVESFLRKQGCDFILLQCGADSIAGDPITHMAYSSKAHAHAAGRLCVLADELCEGRLVAMGGGGYNHDNIAAGWTAVVDSLVSHPGKA